jgi:3-deoxy-manno-octulosonate cytidylyltransferase (CMP-KDO synthetase)
MKPAILAVIPARYESKRYPGKALSRIAGKTLLQWIYDEALKSKLIDRLVVATDSDRIADAVGEFGGEAIMTSARHRTGSDRTAEVLERLGGEIAINIQADHVGLDAAVYDRVIESMLNNKSDRFVTLAKRIDDEKILFNPDRVKLIIDTTGHALWFSRYPLPYLQGIDGDRLKRFDFYYHIGVYFFRKKALENYHSWARSRLEKAESLEQLRIIENRQRIRIYKIKSRIFSIDAPEDLRWAEENLAHG